MSKLQEETEKFTQELREGCFDTTPEPVEKESLIVSLYKTYWE